VEATAPRIEPDLRRWWALALLCGAHFMVILDAAIVTVALPSIEEDLGFSARGLQWVVSLPLRCADSALTAGTVG
jgi:hypothetical protein